uniref:Uncharacterized protein n=1 Tax=Glossina austeni TaxID=7395 RepID=A0A1A9USE7_GLOAU
MTTKPIETNPKETLQQPSPRGSPRINITATEKKEIRGNIGHSLNALNQKSDTNEQPNTNIPDSQPELLGDNVPNSMIRSVVIETLRSELSSLNINATQCQSNNANSLIFKQFDWKSSESSATAKNTSIVSWFSSNHSDSSKVLRNDQSEKNQWIH